MTDEQLGREWAAAYGIEWRQYPYVPNEWTWMQVGTEQFTDPPRCLGRFYVGSTESEAEAYSALGVQVRAFAKAVAAIPVTLNGEA